MRGIWPNKPESWGAKVKLELKAAELDLELPERVNTERSSSNRKDLLRFSLLIGPIFGMLLRTRK